MSLNILITNGCNSTNFVCELKIVIGMHDFSQIYSRLMLIGIFMHT